MTRFLFTCLHRAILALSIILYYMTAIRPFAAHMFILLCESDVSKAMIQYVILPLFVLIISPCLLLCLIIRTAYLGKNKNVTPVAYVINAFNGLYCNICHFRRILTVLRHAEARVKRPGEFETRREPESVDCITQNQG